MTIQPYTFCGAILEDEIVSSTYTRNLQCFASNALRLPFRMPWKSGSHRLLLAHRSSNILHLVFFETKSALIPQWIPKQFNADSSLSIMISRLRKKLSEPLKDLSSNK